MLLDSLKDFHWYNEPANVRFVENGMMLDTEAETDFWQNITYNIHRDNGHFFYTEKQGDFCLTVKWHFDDAIASDQCGLMIRLDSLNWGKISLLSTDMRKLEVGTVITNRGFSDWSNWPLSELPSELWFRVVRKGNDFALYLSLDGISFVRTRMFYFPQAESTIKVGAYACSPQKRSFRCILEDVY
ncbi:MAG: DUF1349 domain-containing protein [Alphaproteobacteria bacterium]|nr:DUF1349 domain-containing protein [Alphaproteobacteria bacterium]